jgi:hypothetical protein
MDLTGEKKLTFKNNSVDMFVDGTTNDWSPFCELFKEWANELPETLQPTHIGKAQPVDTPIEENVGCSFQSALNEWEVFPLIKRSEPPSYMLQFYETIRREDGVRIKSPYAFRLSIDDSEIGILEKALRISVDNLNPRFASIQSDKAFNIKHYYVFNAKSIGDGEKITVRKMRGWHIDDKIPHIDYLTYLRDDCVDEFNLKVKSLSDVANVESFSDGLFIRPYDDFSLSGTEEGIALENEIIERLNRDAFFDFQSVTAAELAEEDSLMEPLE